MRMPYRRLALLGLLLACAGLGCAPKLLGPTSPSGYVFTLQAFPTLIWMGPLDAGKAPYYPETAEVSVRVQDAQGHPVDDVLVTFAVEPGWEQSASLTPPQARTRNGLARVVFQG